jgi:hypothetical protein
VTGSKGSCRPEARKERASLKELVVTASTLERQEDNDRFLRKVDDLGPELSSGKWSKLFALCAEASKITGRNIRIYASSNGWTYDVTQNRAFDRKGMAYDPFDTTHVHHSSGLKEKKEKQ